MFKTKTDRSGSKFLGLRAKKFLSVWRFTFYYWDKRVYVNSLDFQDGRSCRLLSALVVACSIKSDRPLARSSVQLQNHCPPRALTWVVFQVAICDFEFDVFTIGPVLVDTFFLFFVQSQQGLARQFTIITVESCRRLIPDHLT